MEKMRARCLLASFPPRVYCTILLLTVATIFLTGFLIIGNDINMMQMLWVKCVLPHTGGHFESHAMKLTGRSLTSVDGKHDWNNDNQKSNEVTSVVQTIHKIFAGIFSVIVLTFLMMGLFARCFHGCLCRGKEPEPEILNLNRDITCIDMHDVPLSKEGQTELEPSPSTHVTFNDVPGEAASNAKDISCLEVFYDMYTGFNTGKTPGDPQSDVQETLLQPPAANDATELQSSLKEASTDELTATNVLTSEASDSNTEASGPTPEASDPIPEIFVKCPKVENVGPSIST